MFKTEYKIVGDRFLGFEVQYRAWFCPLWLQVGFSNTHSSVEDAEKWLSHYLYVKYV